ncbi:MAG: phosphoglycolate phosphatase [Euryarchaeota archaeon]|nr:phosphoglycolate phosphatase [Euryarchaeota archaeon]
MRSLAIDIDGTITDARRRFNLRAVELLRELEARGVEVILATGNILCVAEAAKTFIGTSGGLIAENGGVIKDPALGVERYLGDPVEVRRALNHLVARYSVTPVPQSELRKTEVALLRDSLSAEEVRRCLRGFDVEVVDTKFAIHIKSPQVSKGRALEELLEPRGVDLSTVAAIGDSENDRDMLERAGYAVAVGESSLADVADLVTTSAYGEGGAEALRHILGLLR